MNKKIRYEILIVGLILAIVVGIFYTYQHNKNQYESSIYEQLEINTNHTKNEFERSYSSVAQSLKRIANYIGQKELTFEQIQEFLRNQAESLRYSDDFYVYDLQKEKLIARNEIHDFDVESMRKRPWFIESGDEYELLLTPLYNDLFTNDFLLTISYRTKTNYDKEYIAILDLRPSDFYREVVIAQDRDGIYQYMVDSNGFMMTHPDEKDLGKNFFQLIDFEVPLEELEDYWNDILEKDSGYIEYTIDQDRILAYYQHLNYHNAILFSAVNTKDFRSDIVEYSTGSFGIYTIIIVLLSALFFMYYYETTYRDSETGFYSMIYFRRWFKKSKNKKHDILFVKIRDIRYYSHSNIEDEVKKYKDFSRYIRTKLGKKSEVFVIQRNEYIIVMDDMQQDKLLESAESIFGYFNNAFTNQAKEKLEVHSKAVMIKFKVKEFNVDRLMKIAGSELKKIKHSGKMVIIEDCTDVLKELDEEAYIRMRLLSALKEERIVPFYQPIYDLKKDRVDKYEVLMRVEEFGEYMSPFPFIILAEKIGVIEKIDEMVIKKALHDKKLYDENHDENIKLSINLSTKDLNIEFMEGLTKFVAQENIDPSDVTFEITETQSIENLGIVREMVQKYKQYGFEFSIDDFGTGFSNTNYLKQLSLDYLKIDGVFVRDISMNRENYYIVKAFRDLAYALGIKVVAEYVESEEVFEVLKKLEVDYVQGYYVGKPEAKIGEYT
ncbi:MAG: EAL domain-containing protein [Tissierellales bacterium]|jgi:EAL domain-containing protein (putative c-di-GMP-specific phosphodiesterase class I)/GGDEF domain-containing protein|nr:EAL domain-containing protein [Tissierellales bacterium]